MTLGWWEYCVVFMVQDTEIFINCIKNKVLQATITVYDFKEWGVYVERKFFATIFKILGPKFLIVHERISHLAPVDFDIMSIGQSIGNFWILRRHSRLDGGISKFVYDVFKFGDSMKNYVSLSVRLWGGFHMNFKWSSMIFSFDFFLNHVVQNWATEP